MQVHQTTANSSNSVQKIARINIDGRILYGLVQDETVREIDGDVFGAWTPTDQQHQLSDVKLLVPTTPSKVIALAGNYRDHLGPDNPVPDHPQPFYKLPTSLLAHEGNIIQPSDQPGIHYEAEVVIVIGKRAQKVAVSDAMDYVFGVTCGNDVSARDWQRNDVQWWRAKGSDTFGPCGPWIAIGLDVGELEVQLRVNGEVRQTTNTRNMIHNIPMVVSFISQHVTLDPGDLIFSGTPGKTKSMSVGDIVEVEIEGVGVLRNRLSE